VSPAARQQSESFGLVEMQYVKRYWNEPRGDAHNAWGCSWWFFEADNDGVVSRQVEVYDHGPTLRYHGGRLRDEFGGLADQPLDLTEFAAFKNGPDDFERVWGTGGE
jgi:hypothetical protein